MAGRHAACNLFVSNPAARATPAPHPRRPPDPMLRALTAIATALALTLAASPALADEPERGALPYLDLHAFGLEGGGAAEDATFVDGVSLYFAAATGGMAATMSFGALARRAEPEDATARERAAGAFAGSFGAALAMHTYGRSRHLRGSFWAGFAGAALGTLSAYALDGGGETDATWYALMLTLPPAAATAGWLASAELDDSPTLDDEVLPPVGSLFVVYGGTVRLGLPDFRVKKSGGGARYQLAIVSGQF
ncbi:MAG: hypothetical protein KC635_26820 [Myxococcales bacterium]|nr:hypothetical protein [Myxococcales bacterium]MCB9732361.1 hypothetical protein [Deltaproteobacteria bacterium]